MSTHDIRLKLVEIAKRDVGKTEESENKAPWISKLWSATTYPDGMTNREPYCAAGMAYCMREWLKIPEVLTAFGFTPEQAEKWRCKSASVFKDPSSNWVKWAKEKEVSVLPKNCILHTADIAVYEYSHIELVVDDDGSETGGFTCIGYNSNGSGSRDGEGCVWKNRKRDKIKCFLRVLP
jgi:hypothetical protein